MKSVRATQQSLLLGELTAREREVLTLLATGNNNRTIAAALGISEGTVKGYVSGILDTLGVQDRTQAALFALKYRFVDGEIDSRT
jgi:DNA-binding NarL/FixJ family response regulator